MKPIVLALLAMTTFGIVDLLVKKTISQGINPIVLLFYIWLGSTILIGAYILSIKTSIILERTFLKDIPFLCNRSR